VISVLFWKPPIFSWGWQWSEQKNLTAFLVLWLRKDQVSDLLKCQTNRTF